MPRVPRLDMPGFHHIVNRGVAKRAVFLQKEDYEFFLTLLCSLCNRYDARLHSYCLMSNHYHLLLETTKDNLSLIMRSLGARYASYFNRRLKRIGHLWQGRFRSWYIADETYLYTVIKYIEFNPLKAKIVTSLAHYKYASYNTFLGNEEIRDCLKESIIFKHYATPQERKEFFNFSYDESDIKQIAKSSRLIVATETKKEYSVKKLEKLFLHVKNKSARNEKIKHAIELGYSQHQIATVLKMSQPAISSILKTDLTRDIPPDY